MITLLLPFIFVILFITDVSLVEFEKFGWTTISLIAFAVAIYYFKLYQIPQFIASNFVLDLVFVLFYIVIGVIWSFIKWYSFLIDYRDKFSLIKDKYLSTRKGLVNAQLKWAKDNKIMVDDKPLSSVESFPLHEYSDIYKRFLNASSAHNSIYCEYNTASREYKQFYKPQFSSYKGIIIAWMCFWVFSLIGTFIRDPLRRLFICIFNLLKKSYQKISDSVFSDFPDY